MMASLKMSANIAAHLSRLNALPWKTMLWRHAIKSSTIPLIVKRAISTGDKTGPKKSGHEHTVHPGNPKFGGDGNIFVVPGLQKRPPGPRTAEEFKDVKGQKNWISYGYSWVYYKEDRWLAHVSFFTGISLMITTSAWMIMYYPDVKLEYWGMREAHMVLEKRERLGLPLINPNFIDPSLIELPTEEEIQDLDVDVGY